MYGRAKIGIIGTGSLGGMLIKAFTGKGLSLPKGSWFLTALPPRQRSLEKICRDWGWLLLPEMVDQCRWIFLCVKPGDLKGLLAETGTVFDQDRLLVSTLLSPSLQELDRLLTGKIVRLYPSVTQSVGHGVNLVCFGSRVTGAEREEFIGLVDRIGKTFVVPKNGCPYGDITSCGRPSWLIWSIP